MFPTVDDDEEPSSSTPLLPKKPKKKHKHNPPLPPLPPNPKRPKTNSPNPTPIPISSQLPPPTLHHHHHHHHHNKLGCIDILKHSILVPTKNPFLVFSAFLVNVVASSLILLFYFLSVNSVILDLTIQLNSLRTIDPLDPLYPLIIAAILKDVGELTSIEIAFIIISIAVAPFVKTITIYAVSVTHSNRPLSFLELFFKALLSLIRSVATQVLVALLFLAYVAVISGVVYLLLVLTKWSSFGYAVSAVVVLLAAPPFLYLVTVCALSVVVAAVEDGYFWTGALLRAMEVMRGKRLLGFSIVIPAIVLVGVAAFVHAVVHRDSRLDVKMQLVEGYVYIFVSEVLNLFILAAITIYYHECQNLRDEEALADVMYASLPSGCDEESCDVEDDRRHFVEP